MSTLKNLEKFIGREWNGDIVDDIICAFEEEGKVIVEGNVIVEDSKYNIYYKLAYINDDNCMHDIQYFFKLEDNIITDVWGA